jgi:hypothetical protein
MKTDSNSILTFIVEPAPAVELESNSTIAVFQPYIFNQA